MSPRETVGIALRELWTNRPALIMLGILVGIAAVIVLVAIGNGVQKSINERIAPLPPPPAQPAPPTPTPTPTATPARVRVSSPDPIV